MSPPSKTKSFLCLFDVTGDVLVLVVSAASFKRPVPAVVEQVFDRGLGMVVKVIGGEDFGERRRGGSEA